MSRNICLISAALLFATASAASAGTKDSGSVKVADFDERMAGTYSVVSNGVKWIDGCELPLEGRVFNDVDHYYDRLPSGVTTNVNAGVRTMKRHTSGMQFRFRTDTKKMTIRWTPFFKEVDADHMPSSGYSGIDVYRYDEKRGRWLFARTGRLRDRGKGGSVTLDWRPGEACIINLPLYNGIRDFSLGIDPEAKVEPLGPRASGVTKPVVFYGTSITHGGCCSRPGMAFPSIIGRELDVPIVNLGFSGSGIMEFEMSEHLARIDASCYVLDCLWNMSSDPKAAHYRSVERNYEAFLRNLRARRPGVPIVLAEQCDVFCDGPNAKDRFVRALYERTKNELAPLVYLPKADMYSGDCEGTVDGCHPNDLGMQSMARAFAPAIREALNLPMPRK